MFSSLSDTFSSIFSRLSGAGTISQKQLDESFELVKNTLLEADVPVHVVTRFIAEIQSTLANNKHARGSLKPAEYVMKVVHDRLVQFLGGSSSGFSFQIPSVSLVVGLQGAGKTTTLAKLARFIQQEAAKRNKKRTILLCSVDFYRPAAIDQLEILARSVDVGFYRAQAHDPIAAAHECVKYARAKGYEHCFIDTAGRLHVDAPLLQEIHAVAQAIKPQYTFLVLDGMIGQESLGVATQFNQVTPITGVIMTKMDSNARGGAALACQYVIKKPVLFVGIGEKPDDLEQFRPERVAQRIIGMGDMQTLIEKAQTVVKIEDQKQLEKSLGSGNFTLDDFAKQLDMMTSLGSLSSVMRYMPGLGSLKMSAEQLDKGERDLKKFKAMLSSMTKKERSKPACIDGSRKIRIARGSGTTPADISLLLERFEESQHFVKMLKTGIHPKGSFPKFHK